MMNVQTQCCQFFKILIKKKSSCFYKGWFVFFCHAGVPIYNWKKLKSGKVKTKKWLCTD